MRISDWSSDVCSSDLLFAQAEACGLDALAITDRNTLAGIVRAHEAAKLAGVRLIVGCRLDLSEGQSLLVYPMNRAGYARLCRLLSQGKTRGGKGKCVIGWADVEAFADDLLAIFLPDEVADTEAVLGRFARIFEGKIGRAHV